MEQKSINPGELLASIKVNNLDELTDLINKAYKDAEQLNETIAQINRFKPDVDASIINTKIRLDIDGEETNGRYEIKSISNLKESDKITDIICNLIDALENSYVIRKKD